MKSGGIISVYTIRLNEIFYIYSLNRGCHVAHRIFISSDELYILRPKSFFLYAAS